MCLAKEQKEGKQEMNKVELIKIFCADCALLLDGGKCKSGNQSCRELAEKQVVLLTKLIGQHYIAKDTPGLAIIEDGAHLNDRVSQLSGRKGTNTLMESIIRDAGWRKVKLIKEQD